ncbi:MAG: DUF6340 family protein, partial [Candidatus Cryptobacteroides sp.]
MKTLINTILAASAVLVAACAPTVYGIQVETRQPSASGLDLTGKSVAIVYPGGVNEKEDALNISFVSALAKQMDASYPESDSVSVFSLPYSASYDLNFKTDSLVNLVLESDCDVLFMLDRSPLFESGGYKQGDFRIPLTVYDSMGGDSKSLRSFNIVGNAGQEPSKSGELIGRRVSESFVPQWKTEIVDVYCLDREDWNEALYDAAACKWATAIEKWTGILSDENDILKRACLEYNIALGCLMMGRPDLAGD